MIPEVKCLRCGETFSSMRSRCPNCGTRRVTQSSRNPSPTPGTVKGTAAFERAETNTKWQIIFGLILVAAVVLAVIVMVTTSLEGADVKQQQTVITPPVVTEYIPPIEEPPTPPPTPTPTVEGLRVMFFTTEIQTDFTIWVDDPIDLTVQVMPLTLQGLAVEWRSSKPSILAVERTDDYAVHVECHDDGSLPKSATLTLTCAGYTKELTVYCRPAK
jgi:DNA-directed RNA polymerase subunit RPC12/RpoP